MDFRQSLIVLSVVSMIGGIILVLSAVNGFKHAEESVEQLRKQDITHKRNPITMQTYKKLQYFLLVLGMLFFVSGITIMVIGIKFVHPYHFPSHSEPTVTEKQMNDLDYVNEGGKWNYEGGDAGQNDGRSGD